MSAAIAVRAARTAAKRGRNPKTPPPRRSGSRSVQRKKKEKQIFVQPSRGARLTLSTQSRAQTQRARRALSTGTTQATASINAAMRSSRGHVRRLATTMTLPCQSATERVSGAVDAGPTAVASVWSVSDIDVRAPDTDTYYALPGQVMFYVSRQAWCNTVTYLDNLARAQQGYDVLFPGASDGQPSVTAVIQPSEQFFEPAILYAVATVGMGWNPHGLLLASAWGGEGNERKAGIWIDATPAHPATLQIAGVATGLGFPAQVNTLRFNGRTWVKGNFTTAAAGLNWSVLISLTQSGYYRFSVYSHMNGTTTGSMTAKWTSTAPSMGHAPMPSLSLHYTNVEEMTTIGTALLITPASAEMYSSGYIEAVQCPQQMSWENMQMQTPGTGFSASNSRSWSALPGYKRFSAKQGFYGFVRPTCAAALNPVKINTDYERNASVLSINFEIRPPCGWMCVRIVSNTPDLTSTSYPMQDWSVVLTTAAQYTTYDRWYNTLHSDSFDGDVEMALKLVAACPQFHENPLHLSDILGFLRRAGKQAIRVAPAILTALGAALPQYAPELNLASGAANALKEYIG